MSFVWRPDDDFFRRLRVAEETGHLCGFDETTYKTLGEARVIRTGFCSYMLREPLLGVRWGWWSNHRAGHRRLLWCEGKLSAMQEAACASVSGEPGAPSALVPCARAAEALFTARFRPCELPPIAKVRRMDPAADVEFTDAADGLRLLHGMSLLRVPGLKSDVWRSEGLAETLYLRQAGGIRWRIYDKGAERASRGATEHMGRPIGQPGSLIRFERQLHFAKPAQAPPEDLDPKRLAELWLGELAPWTRVATDVIAAGLPQAPEAVIAAARRGEITREQAERLVGHVMIQACGASQEFWASKPHTLRRREAELRAIGVAVDGLAWDASVCFPLGKILRGVQRAWCGSDGSLQAHATRHAKAA